MGASCSLGASRFHGSRSVNAENLLALDNLLVWEPSGCSVNNGIDLEAKEIRKFNCPMLRAINGYEDGVAAITLLSLPVRPSAIVWLIVPIVVDAIDCKAFGSRPHIFGELTKVMNPLVAYFYATAAIVLELRIVGIVAAILHRPPDMVALGDEFERHHQASLCG